MKKIFIIATLLSAMIACKKESVESSTTTIPTPITNLNEQTLLLQGTFVAGVHATTGTVKVYEDKDKKRSLIFENFKTDAGPDLRIYMAEDKAITNFVEISDKVSTTGSYSLAIPANVDLKKQTTVAIWCKSFSVLFGSATLK